MRIILLLFVSVVAFGQGILAPIRNGLNVTSGGGGGASFSVLSSNCAPSSTGNNVTTTAINSTGATLLVVGMAWQDVGPPTLTSSPSETFTSLTIYNDDFNAAKVQIFYVIAPTGASHTFTASSTSLLPSLCAVAIKDTGGTNTFQSGSDVGAHQNSSATIQPGTVTPGVNNSIVIQMLSSAAPLFAPAPSISAPFTLIDSADWTVNSLGYGLAYEIQTTATARNPTWTTTNSSFGVAASAAVFNP